jgi:hypothetical protein
MRPNIIDIEASGFGPDSYPIEVGFVLGDGQKYCTLISPLDEWVHWDEQAEQVHGISRRTLATHGEPAAQVAAELNRLLQGRTVYSDYWSVDQSWLNTLFYATRMMMGFHLSSIELIMSESQIEDWQSKRDAVLAEHGGNRHRASYDAWVIQETFARSCSVR